jgi:hypothetical protein
MGTRSGRRRISPSCRQGARGGTLTGVCDPGSHGTETLATLSRPNDAAGCPFHLMGSFV